MTAAKKAPSPDLIGQLLAGYQKPEDLIGDLEKKQSNPQGSWHRVAGVALLSWRLYANRGLPSTG